VRVVAGTAAGLRLHAPPGRVLRPTSERVREAVFSSLASMGVVDGATFVDLFAGTGALGIEALSRGAAHAWFVEDDPVAIATIDSNLERTGLAAAATVERSDVVRFLERREREYDVALVDPPYGFQAWDEVLARLRADAAVLESDRVLDVGPGWRTTKHKRYGDTVVTVVAQVRAGD
jgi:16S rRNA (guanine966-N2)-methyltransferase